MDQFRDKGWNLTAEGFKKISEDGKITHFPTLLKKALDTDLREIGDYVFPTDSRSKYEVPKQGLVLQVMKIIRNVAAPKANQDSKFAPRLLKIQFTDGQNQFSGIEIDHLSVLSMRDTKPGTKLFFRPGKVIQLAQDLLLLRANTFDVLGGHVQELVDKWEVAQRYSKYSTGIRALTQAPPWIAFGQKIDRKSINLHKKSLAGGGDKKEGEDDKEDAAFDNQRKEAIAEAQKLEPKQRVFQDGAKKLVHHNVQKIVDKGYTEEQAKEALRYTRNDLGKALANLKRGGAEEGDGRFRNNSGRGGRGGGRGGRRGGGRYGGGDDDEEEFMAKPSEKISLFDFIGDKLPPEVKNAAPAAKSSTTAAPPAVNFNRQASYGEARGNKFGASHTHPHGEGSNRFDRESKTLPRSHPRGGNNSARPEHQRPSAGAPHQQNFNPRSGAPNSRAPTVGNNLRNERSNNNNNYHQGNHSQPYQPRTHHQAPDLSRDMERMTLSNNNNSHHSHRQPHHSQRQQENRVNLFPALDTRRTPGFANKESNEAAKKFLEQQEQPVLSQPGPQFQMNHRAPPKHHQQAGAAAAAAPGNSSNHGSKSTWNWKLGDRCLAKYWEDGKYYNAEITGVAPGPTCVVHFMEYGNYEEVLKDDCLPITG